MTVADMERSVQFYSSVLSFEKVSDVRVISRGIKPPLGCSWVSITRLSWCGIPMPA
jgi:hypothetical protein